MPNLIYNTSSNFSTRKTDFTQNKSDYKKIFNSSGAENLQLLPIAMNINNKITQIPKINLNFNININCDNANQVDPCSSREEIDVLDSVYETITNIEESGLENKEISKIFSSTKHKLETPNKDEKNETSKPISSRRDSETCTKTITYPWMNTRISEVRFDLKKQIDLDFLRHNFKCVAVRVK